MDLSLPSTAQETGSERFTNYLKLTVSNQLWQGSKPELCGLGRALDSGVANYPLPTVGCPILSGGLRIVTRVSSGKGKAPLFGALPTSVGCPWH